jgi:hypothetical protein
VLARRVRPAQQHTPARRPVQQQRQHIRRYRIRPVDIVQQQRQRSLRPHPLQEGTHRPRHTVTLARRRHRLYRRQRPNRRQHRRQLAQLPTLELLDRPGKRRIAHKRLERIQQERERQITLELGGPTLEHQQTKLLRPPRKLPKQARLPNPGLAPQRHRPRTPLLDLNKRPLERRKLLAAPHQHGSQLGHTPA